jgi:hypothetical protein
MAPKRKNVEVEAQEEDEEYDEVEEDLAFSRNYFLAKEVGSSSGKRSAARKVSEINLVDEAVRFSPSSICLLSPKFGFFFFVSCIN